MANIQKLPVTSALPRWAYIVLAIACICMGLWASSVTLQYFEHGAKALETDPVMQALALSAALMFVASEMGAFGLAALLTERQLWARRWMLYGFAGAVLALEVFTIVAVQLALTVGADMTQTTTADQEKDLRARIAAIESSAASKRATADKQRLTARDGYELKLSARSGAAATEEQAKTDALYAELKTVQAQKRPTLTGLLGEKTAIAYAVARGVLVSLGGLVFFGVAGALMRAARGGVLSVDQQILQLLHELRGTPGALGAPAQTVAPAAAPALASFKPAGTVSPAAGGLSYTSKMALAGAGALGVMGAAPMAQAAPAVPAAASATAPEPAHSAAHGAPVPAQSAAQSVSKKRPAVQVGAKLDTGTSGHAATRYNRIKAAVMSGKLKPSTRAVQAAEGGGGDVVKAYLQQLEKDGVTVRKGRGYVTAGSVK